MTHNRAKTLEAFDYAIERITEASKSNGGLVYDAALNAYFMLKDHGKKIREALTEPKWKSMDSCPADTHGKSLIFTDGKVRWFDTVPPTFDKELRSWIGEDSFENPIFWTDTAPLPTGEES